MNANDALAKSSLDEVNTNLFGLNIFKTERQEESKTRGLKKLAKKKQ